MTNQPLAAVLAALRAAGHIPKKSGAGWTCTCPAHADANPSLSVGGGDDGRALVHCFAGCAPDLVLRAIGLTFADLMPDRGTSSGVKTARKAKPRVTRTPRNAVQSEGSSDNLPPSAFTKVEAIRKLEDQFGPISASWIYHGDHGEEVGVIARFNRAQGKKIIRAAWYHPDRGGWVLKGFPKPAPLYGLPSLLKVGRGSTVVVTEGEGVTDVALSLGWTATTSVGGAERASGTDWSPLSGQHVVILVDHDSAGEGFATDVTELVFAVGAASVRIVRLVELWRDIAKGGDLVDFLAHRGGDARGVRAEVNELIDRTSREERPVVNDVTITAPVLDPVALFPVSLEFARDYLVEVARSSQTPSAMPLLLGLGIASGCVANVAVVRGYGDYVEPAQIWALVLSDSATRKTSVITELLRPIISWERSQAEALSAGVAAAVQCRKLLEKRLNHLEQKAARATIVEQRESWEKQAVEVAIELANKPIPSIPVLLVTEPTPEALEKQMAENGGRALLASAEADAIDIIQGRYAGVRNYGTLLKGHGGDSIRSPRIGRPALPIDHAAVAVALCVQTAAVEEVWNDPQAKGRGLLARFAVITPEDLVGRRTVRPKPISLELRERWGATIQRLLSFRPTSSPVVIGLSREADAEFLAFQKRVERSLGCGDLYDRREWGGKLCGLSLRIALTLHALETWGLEGTPADAHAISSSTMKSGIAWAEYLAASELFARSRIHITEPMRAQHDLVRWLRAWAKPVTASELAHNHRRFRNDPDGADQSLTELQAAGLGHWLPVPPGAGGGRPTRTFIVAAGTDVTETYPNREQSNGCGDAGSGDAE